jgi:ubiquinone/menaquinone biosynthesis C-methylase UbiE
MKKVIPGVLAERWNLYRMRSYWNRCARENARKHIAIDDWQNEDAFHESGLRDLKKILGDCTPLSGGGRILEIGCGIGRLLKPLALERSDIEIYGVDVSTEMIQQARERMSSFPHVYFFPVNGRDLSLFGKAYFDLVFSYITFQHMPRLYVSDLCKEVFRVLKKEGMFIFQLQLLNQNTMKEPLDNDYRSIRYYSPGMVQALAEAGGFTVQKINQPNPRDGYVFVSLTK